MPLPSILGARDVPPVRFRSLASSDAGFTYIGLLILLAIIALVASASLQVGSILQRRAAEEELLAIGLEFRHALQSYAARSPVGQKRYPASLADLIKDPRFPNTVRHLRKIYVDPLTGNAEWGIVNAVDGKGVIAVFSLSQDKPIKVGNFDPVWQGFESSESYQRWRFGATAVITIPNQPNNAARNVNQALSIRSADQNFANTPPMSREVINQLNQSDGANDMQRP